VSSKHFQNYQEKNFLKKRFAFGIQNSSRYSGKGSGFDVAAAVYGGTLYFVIGGKILKPLNLTSLPLIVGYSGIKG